MSSRRRLSSSVCPGCASWPNAASMTHGTFSRLPCSSRLHEPNPVGIPVTYRVGDGQRQRSLAHAPDPDEVHESLRAELGAHLDDRFRSAERSLGRLGGKIAVLARPPVAIASTSSALSTMNVFERLASCRELSVGRRDPAERAGPGGGSLVPGFVEARLVRCRARRPAGFGHAGRRATCRPAARPGRARASIAPIGAPDTDAR